MTSKRGWALLAIWADGSLEYVKGGAQGGGIFVTPSLKVAREMREGLWIGLEGDAQSLNIVRPPQGDGRPTMRGMRAKTGAGGEGRSAA